MTKAKFLAILAVMVLILTLPSIASAQRLPPHVFVGTAWIDDAAAAEGTTVTAWVAGAQVAATTTTGTGGDYTLIVDQGDASFAGETISFQVGGYDAGQSAEWMEGGGDELTLSASSSAVAGKVVSITLDEVDSSGQSGTATLTEMDSMTQVVLSISAGSSQSELVHIHTGQCGDTLGGVAHSLTNFAGGSGASTTMVEGTLASLQNGDHAINAHDASDASVYTVCGNIPAVAMDGAMVPGATGMPGEAGSRGPTGRTGATGPDGADGPAGDQGPGGLIGDTGPAGSAGAAGATGDTGLAGARGTAGATGAAGLAGEGGSGAGAIGIVALILAIIAIVGAGGAFVLSRRG